MPGPNDQPFLFEDAPRPATSGKPGELKRVWDWLKAHDPDGARFARVLRESLDQVLDGPRTGRFRYSDLRKTEKTHVGTIVEINVAKEFDLSDGIVMDYTIDAVEVDCKYSMTLGEWELPRESMGHVVLLTWANDMRSKWSAGLWRVDPEKLRRGKNLDSKRNMLAAARPEISWIWWEEELDENLLLHLDPKTLDQIISIQGPRTGQKRMNQLFRLVQRRIIRREVVLTVGRQKDSPRRARMTREPKQLGNEGIIVLGHYEWDVAIARDLGLPIPKSGEWVSTRVARVPQSSTRPKFAAQGHYWAEALDGESVEPAPPITHGKSLDDED